MKYIVLGMLAHPPSSLRSSHWILLLLFSLSSIVFARVPAKNVSTTNVAVDTVNKFKLFRKKSN